MHTYVETPEFLAYASARGLKAEPLLNTGEVGMDGVPLRVMGYTLLGPRGSRKVVGKNTEGRLSLFDAQLFADGVDYATKRLAERARTAR